VSKKSLIEMIKYLKKKYGNPSSIRKNSIEWLILSYIDDNGKEFPLERYFYVSIPDISSYSGKLTIVNSDRTENFIGTEKDLEKKIFESGNFLNSFF